MKPIVVAAISLLIAGCSVEVGGDDGPLIIGVEGVERTDRGGISLSDSHRGSAFSATREFGVWVQNATGADSQTIAAGTAKAEMIVDCLISTFEDPLQALRDITNMPQAMKAHLEASLAQRGDLGPWNQRKGSFIC